MTLSRSFFFCLLLIPGLLTAQNGPWSLQQCIDHALENNIQLQQQELQVKTSDINRREANAARWPDLNFFSNYNFLLGYVADPFTNQFDQQEISSLNLSLQSRVNLFNGNRINNTINQRKLENKAARDDLEQQKLDLILDITTGYLQILLNRELLKAAEQQLASTEEQRDRTARLVQAGSIPEADLIQIESQVAAEELNITNATNNLQQSYLNLAQLLRLPGYTNFEILIPEVEIADLSYLTMNPEEVYASAESYQPFIDAADTRIEAADKGVHVAKGQYYPSIFASGTFFTGYSSARKRATFDTLAVSPPTDVLINDQPAQIKQLNVPFQQQEGYPIFDQLYDQRSLQLTAGLSIPIYNRRNAKSAVQRAEVQLAQQRLNAELQRQTLRQSIERAFQNMRNAYASYQANQKQVEALELNLQNTEKRFNLGAANSTEYLQAKIRIDIAQADLLRSKYDYIFRTKIIDFFTGKPMRL